DDPDDSPGDSPGGGGGGGGGMMGSDDDAIRQIRRRISPVGWLLIIAVLGAGGGTGYYMFNSAIETSREEDELQRGRLELSTISQRADQTPAQSAAQI